jgi:hypothetical protein
MTPYPRGVDCHEQAVIHIRESRRFELMFTLQGKPDQQATRIPRSVHVWSQTIRISHGQCIATFHVVVNRVGLSHCSWEKGLLTQSTACGWPIHGSIPSFSPEPTNEAVGAKPTFCWWADTRLTGSISLACDQYIQYLLTGANQSVLNRHRRGLQPWRCQLVTYHSPTFPTDGLHFPPKGPTRSPVKSYSTN